MTHQFDSSALEAVTKAAAAVENAKFTHDLALAQRDSAAARYEITLDILERAHADLHFALERLQNSEKAIQTTEVAA